MNIVEIRNLSRHFKILNRQQGLAGAFKDLFSKDYNIVKAVDDISFSVGEGEIVGFIGPNGAGKSTTIKMMTGVLKPTSGEININGYIPYKNRIEYVKNIGVVFGQRTQLWWDLPVIESFRILKDIYMLDDKVFSESMNIFTELVNIDQLFSKTVRSLSLGQRMLCDIASSFLHNPKIIFLDEPTIGLDVSIKNKIRHLIKNLNEINKTTIILTTHDMNDIEALCKRIIIIDKGKILFDGDIGRVSSIYGAYRILRIQIQNPDIDTTDVQKKIGTAFPKAELIIDKNEENWLNFTFNQDEMMLMELLGYLTREFSIKDIRVDEIELESIVKKIYEGGLK